MGQYYVGSQMNRTYYISHHGILGQKWGIRRFQNKDGSYTDQGRKRYSAGQYQRQLNKTDKQVSKEIYKREKLIGKDNILTRKAMKKTKEGMTEVEAKNLLKEHNKLQKAIDDSEKLIKEGEAVMNKTMASALERGYSINSNKVLRNVSSGRKAYSSLCGFGGGILIGIPASMIGIASYNAVKRAQGYSEEGATGVIEGNKFRVRKTPEGQNPTLRSQFRTSGITAIVESEIPRKKK